MSTVPAAVERQQQTWQAFTDFLNQWFYLPDMDALAVILTAGLAHQRTEADPLWLHIIGPSRSGKTVIGIGAVSGLPNAQILGAPTPKTFLSGLKIGPESSLLLRAGERPFFLFKDFTSILSLRDEDRRAVCADLREIYDGYLHKPTGTGSKEWRGKATVIAACTPTLDRAWALQRDLGERFLSVRWPRRDGSKAAEMACKQRGHERDIARRIREFGVSVINGVPTTILPEMNEAQKEQRNHLSEVLAVLRGKVHREAGRYIDGIHIEDTPGIAKGLDALIRFHAQLFGRETVEDADFAAGVRVALDSIPPNRRAVFQAIPTGAETSTAEVQKLAGLPADALEYTLADLEALGVVSIQHSTVSNDYSLCQIFARSVTVAFPNRP